MSPESTEKKPLSDAQLRANRENARKSTGPRTEEGKAASSMNASKHTIFSRHVCLAPEDHETLNHLRRFYQQRFQPADNLESSLVDQLVTLHWHRLRIQFIAADRLQMEAEMIDPAALGFTCFMTPMRKVALAYEKLANESKIFAATDRALARLSREYSRTFRDLLNLRNEVPLDGFTPADLLAWNPPQQPQPAPSAETAQNEPIPSAAETSTPPPPVHCEFCAKCGREFPQNEPIDPPPHLKQAA